MSGVRRAEPHDADAAEAATRPDAGPQCPLSVRQVQHLLKTLAALREIAQWARDRASHHPVRRKAGPAVERAHEDERMLREALPTGD